MTKVYVAPFTFADMLADQVLFDFIHRDLANPFFDWLLPVYREKAVWVPAYLLIIGLLYKEYGARRTVYLLVCIGVVIGVADQLAASVLKPLVGRLRPCAGGELAGAVRELVGCGGKWSFPSNHATNHFALAHLLALTYLRGRRGWQTLAYAWAATICFAQVYVGKHWPGDVLGGAILGLAIAGTGVLLYRRLAKQKAIVGHPSRVPGRARV